MVAVICSMYYEAKAFIEYYGLKKISSSLRFQIFLNSEIILAVSGVGNMNSAICSAHIVTAYKVNLLVNVGICAAYDKKIEIGSAYICNKIISETGKFFYPDILYKHDFYESEIFSSFRQLKKNELNQKKCLYDMESFGIMETAYIFLSPNQAAVIKIISDYGDSALVTPDIIYKLTGNSLSKIAELIETIKSFNESFQLTLLSEADTQAINDLCRHFKFTASMEYEIIKRAKLYKLKNNSSLSFLKKHMATNTKTKNEGKAVFNVIKQELS